MAEYRALNEAVELVARAARITLDVEVVRPVEAVGRILAEDIVAKWDEPPFDRVEVDGYAVRSKDVAGATHARPVRLALRSDGKGEPLTCVRVATGDPLPKGYDAAVMAEDTDEEDGFVEVYASVPPYGNVTRKGADFRAGDVVLKAGALLSPMDVVGITSYNYVEVRVFRKPKLAILNVGDELVPLGSEVPPGRRVNSQEHLLSSLARYFGFEPLALGIAPDDEEVVRRKVEEALALCDAVVTTGGTAVSAKDVVVKAVRSMGPEVHVHGLRIRPGRPTAAAVVRGRPVFNLSGNVAASSVAFVFFVVPAIYRSLGLEAPKLPTVRAILEDRVPGRPGFTNFVRVKVKREGGRYYASRAGLGGSGMISTVAGVDGFLIVPERVEGFEAGAEVEVHLIRPALSLVTQK